MSLKREINGNILFPGLICEINAEFKCNKEKPLREWRVESEGRCDATGWDGWISVMAEVRNFSVLLQSCPSSMVTGDSGKARSLAKLRNMIEEEAKV